MNIFFYSRNCKTSNALYTILTNEELIEHFKLYCIEDHLDEISKLRLKGIKKVPTLIVSNISKPLEVEEAFRWVESIKAMKQNKFMELLKQQEEIEKQNKAEIEKKKRLLGYIDTEMGKFSDKFAYLNFDAPIPHTFKNAFDEGKDIIFTPPQENKKIPFEEQKKAMSIAEKKRSEEEEIFSKKLRDTQAYLLMEKTT
jgi:hypothetical protein